LTAPVLETVEAAPAPVERPNAPKAVGPTRSKLLEAAYRTMLGGNAYESAGGMEMYREGLSDQDRLNEAAAEREQRLIDMGFQTDLSIYGDAQSTDRRASHDARAAGQQRNFDRTQTFEQNRFTAGESQAGRTHESRENALSRAAQAAEGARNRAAQAALQRDQQAFQLARDQATFAHDLKRFDYESAAKRADRRAAFNATATGYKANKADMDAIGQAGQYIGKLNEFERLARDTKTGGLILGNIPGTMVWSSTGLQRLNALTQGLVAGNAKLLPGALSDKEGARLEAMMPNIRKTNRANLEDIAFLRAAANRNVDMINAFADARATGTEMEFRRSWQQFTKANDVNNGVSYEAWIGRTQFDRNGNPIGGK
jgi:hypothetical protein